MKKWYVTILLFSVLIFSGCVGQTGSIVEYTVSGYVYYPDSVTPLPKAAVGITDHIIYSAGYLTGSHPSERDYGTYTDNNGYFEITIPTGGAQKIEIYSVYRPQSDTAILYYQYIAHPQVIKYTGKHCFENLKLVTAREEVIPIRPYYEPSYPFIGDSVKIIGRGNICLVNLFEDNSICLHSQEYDCTQEEVMFYVPETCDVGKSHQFEIFYEGEYSYGRVTLRKKKT